MMAGIGIITRSTYGGSTRFFTDAGGDADQGQGKTHVIRKALAILSVPTRRPAGLSSVIRAHSLRVPAVASCG